MKASTRPTDGANAPLGRPVIPGVGHHNLSPQPPAAWAPLFRRLVQGARLRRPPATWSLGCEYPCSAWVETHVAPGSYSWDGLERPVDPRGPFAVFQLTLAGFGAFEVPGKAPQPLPPGTAFLGIIPSAHRYYLPERSPGWTFGWFDTHHPYIVERIARHIDRHGPLLHLAANDAFTAQATHLVDRLTRREFPDAFALEAALFEFIVACDRWTHQAQYPTAERERLLQELRDALIAEPHRPLRVESLARRRGMSRSHFSHYFKARTGLTPAAFATALRIQEATHLLLSSAAPLKEIAAALGFASVNHFCKVFRRHLHTSPAAYRRQSR